MVRPSPLEQTSTDGVSSRNATLTPKPPLPRGGRGDTAFLFPSPLVGEGPGGTPGLWPRSGQEARGGKSRSVQSTFALVAFLALLAPLAFVPAACGVVNVAATTGGPGGTTLDDGGTITPDGSSLVPPDASTATDGGFCSGSGPIIPVPGAGTTCTGDLPSRTFLFAVCACNDVSVSGVLTTDALNSSSGATGQSAGSIGANGAFDTNSQLLVQGDVWAASSGVATAVQVSQSGTITGDVHAGANVVAEQPLTIDGNLSANGSVTGTVTCGGTVTIPAGDTASATTADGGLVNAPVTVVPPCDCTNLLDVPTIVSGFASANDDSAAGLTPSSLSPAPATTVTLPCGRYYFDGINGSTVNLSIAGRAAVFVNGDLDATSSLSITLVGDAQLDLFISGNLILQQGATIGSPSAPANARVYVGGSTFTLSGDAQLGANVYAPHADVQLSSNFAMAGSLFVGSLALSGSFTIHYDESVLSTSGCAPSGSSCETCHQCSGATPACKSGTCTTCVTDDDCCPPLKCSAGQCYAQIP